MSLKPKPAAPARPKRRPEVDRLAELLVWEADNKDKINELKKLKENYAAEARAAVPAEKEYTLEGVEFTVTVEAEKMKRVITDVKVAQKLLGDEVFYANASVPLGVIDDYLNPQERAQCTTEGRNGGRTISVKRVVRRAE